MVSFEEVTWAYRLILGRDPENEVVVADAMECASAAVLIQRFLSSDEYRMRRFSGLNPGVNHDRLDEIRTYINRESTGIEIGPWFNPICPKKDGYSTLILDVFDQAELIARAEADPGIDKAMIERIEPVDIVGSVAEMDDLLASHDLAGKLDYVVSSHNIEHVPDLIRFFRACSTVLKSDGVLSMAIPDKRTCFDHFQPHSTTGEVLEAFWSRRVRPSPSQIFSHIAQHAVNPIDGINRIGWGLVSSPGNIVLQDTISNAYDMAQRHLNNQDEPYFDAHCWAFTPSSFEAIIIDLNALGLINLSVRRIVSYGGHEFFAHLEQSTENFDANSDQFRANRSELMRKIVDENAEHTRKVG